MYFRRVLTKLSYDEWIERTQFLLLGSEATEIKRADGPDIPSAGACTSTSRHCSFSPSILRRCSACCCYSYGSRILKTGPSLGGDVRISYAHSQLRSTACTVRYRTLFRLDLLTPSCLVHTL